MTRLTKQVRRELCRTTEQHRPIIVTLEPGDVISFRQKGCRKVWRTSLEACLHMAIKSEALAAQKAKRETRRTRA